MEKLEPISFVFGDTEVKKTGRIATKPGINNTTLTLIEITPVSEFEGTWKKFVSPNALLTISFETKTRS